VGAAMLEVPEPTPHLQAWVLIEKTGFHLLENPFIGRGLVGSRRVFYGTTHVKSVEQKTRTD